MLFLEGCTKVADVMGSLEGCTKVADDMTLSGGCTKVANGMLFLEGCTTVADGNSLKTSNITIKYLFMCKFSVFVLSI